ncbi:MAG: hypothetical protein AB7G06_03685 [Bdellovibrionales bacterium]
MAKRSSLLWNCAGAAVLISAATLTSATDYARRVRHADAELMASVTYMCAGAPDYILTSDSIVFDDTADLTITLRGRDDGTSAVEIGGGESVSTVLPLVLREASCFAPQPDYITNMPVERLPEIVPTAPEDVRLSEASAQMYIEESPQTTVIPVHLNGMVVVAHIEGRRPVAYTTVVNTENEICMARYALNGAEPVPASYQVWHSDEEQGRRFTNMEDLEAVSPFCAASLRRAETAFQQPVYYDRVSQASTLATRRDRSVIDM